MATLVVEIRKGENWQATGRLEPGQPAGSLSNRTEHGRDIIQFRATPDGAIIERSIGGADHEAGPLRVLHTIGLERLATLTSGESYEIDVRTDRMTEPVPLRFRCTP